MSEYKKISKVGFTLIEVLIVLAVMTITFGIVSTLVSSFSNTKITELTINKDIQKVRQVLSSIRFLLVSGRRGILVTCLNDSSLKASIFIFTGLGTFEIDKTNLENLSCMEGDTKIQIVESVNELNSGKIMLPIRLGMNDNMHIGSSNIYFNLNPYGYFYVEK